MLDMPTLIAHFTGTLNRRFLTGTAAGLVSSSLVFLVLFVNLYSEELQQETATMMSQVNSLLRTSLENAMLKRDLEGLQFIVAGLGNQPGIRAVSITNPEGEVRFSSLASRLGSRMPLPAQSPLDQPSASFVTGDEERELMRSIHPVRNRAACGECHGPVERRPINGILYVDYDAAQLRAKARTTTMLLMGSGALIVLLNLAGGWWFIRRYVLTPVADLAAASRALAAGQLEVRLHSQGADELAALGRTFDQMATSLQDKIRELSDKETFLQALVDAIPDGVRIIGPDYRLLLVNRAYREQLGLSADDRLPGHCHDSSHGRSTPCPPTLVSCPLVAIRQQGRPIKILDQHRRQDGSQLVVEVYAAPLRTHRGGQEETLVVESIRDLQAQIKYSHEHKLAELGKLAAGVAHEIHNPLGSVRLALHALSGSPGSTPPAEMGELLQLVNREVDQCLAVTERLLRLSALPAGETEIVDVNLAVQDTLSLLRWEAEQRRIKLEIDLPEPPLRVLATDTDVRMLTLNIAQNAFHAMPRGGSLRVQGRRQAGKILLAFEDAGIGIAAEDLKRIFDPFFSRRADGSQGTGLGLAICQAIVNNHKGRIEVTSVPGEGSRFTIHLADADHSGGLG